MDFNLICFFTCIMSTLAAAPPIQISPDNYSNKKSCQNGGTMTKGSGSSTNCQCPEGYIGKYCQNKVNPCSSNPCRNGGKCMVGKKEKGNGKGSGNDKHIFKCTCAQGYTGVTCADPEPIIEKNFWTTPAQSTALDWNIRSTESVIDDPTYPPDFDPTTAKEAPHRKPRRSTSWSTTVLATGYTDISSELITVPSGMKSLYCS
ncbi:delta and Notch-like epidermal growth factor-related receptor [Anneissia japonica]|uniref:delta and Notch-like epidermal growth factor-related receptor n=1 Tax=Anneissia japonica TaxID=1529436 RepID=UPI00142572BE|nr:delta and Notch-like epidermal growth factor-related receptor [Anneissia japonica]